MRKDSATATPEEAETAYKPFELYELEITGRVLNYIEERFDASNRDLGEIKSLLNRVKSKAGA